MLEAWLDFHRAPLALKCSGLKDDQLRLAAVPPSSMTLLGLVQHLAEVERSWFQRSFSGQDVPPSSGRTTSTAMRCGRTEDSTRRWLSGRPRWPDVVS